MHRKIILFAFFLVLVSFAYSESISIIGSAEKFDKILIDGKEAYTTADLYKSDVFIASDKYLYGSSTGTVNVKVYFQAKRAGNYTFGLQTKGKSIILKNLETGKGTGKIDQTGSTIKPTETFFVDEKTKEITFTLVFNPATTGLQEEFDIIVYNDLGAEVARLDPFLSGWLYRIPITIQAKTAYAPYTFLLNLTPAILGDKNQGFWNNQKADGTDIRFAAYSDGTTLYPYQRIYYVHDRNATFTISMPSIPAMDYNIFMYYGNAAATDVNEFVVDGNFDNFEDGQYTTNPTWTVDGGTADVNTLAKYDGTYGFKLNAGETTVHATLPDTNSIMKLSAWIYSPADGGGCARFMKLSEGATSLIYVKLNANCDEGRGIYDYNSDSLYHKIYITSASTWYRLEIDYFKGWPTANYIIYNTAGAVIANFTGTVNTVGNPTRVQLSASNTVTGYYDDFNANYPQFHYIIDANETATSEFTYNVNGFLDPENGINSINVDFNDLSTYAETTPVSWKWQSNSVQFSTDQNTTKAYTIAADYNVCYDVNAINDLNVYFVSERCKTVTVSQAAQGLGISYDINHYLTTDVNVLFKGTGTGTVTNWYWQYDGAYFGSTQNSQKIFTAANSDANICVTAKIGDINKTKCTRHYVSEIMVKIPIKESDGVTLITPFGLIVNSVPPQTYSGLVADTNYFNFSASNTTYNLTVDANDTLYFDRIYAFSTATANYTLQPYLADATTGTSIKIITLNEINNTTIGNVTVSIYKNLSVVGRVLIESIVTDSKGEAFTSGVINNEYEYEVYYQGIYIDTFDITVTSTTIYISFNPSVISTLPDGVSATVTFNPAITGLYEVTATTQFQQTFNYLGATATSIRVLAKQIDVNGIVYDANLYSNYITIGITSGYTNTIIRGTQLSGWDENLMIKIYAEICFSDGNCYQRTQSYKSPNSSVAGETWKILTKGVWTDLGCTGETCPFLMLMSLLISISVVSYLAITNPLPEVGNHLGIVFILVLGLFVVINWLHWAIWLIAALATFFISTVSREAMK